MGDQGTQCLLPASPASPVFLNARDGDDVTL